MPGDSLIRGELPVIVMMPLAPGDDPIAHGDELAMVAQRLAGLDGTGDVTILVGLATAPAGLPHGVIMAGTANGFALCGLAGLSDRVATILREFGAHAVGFSTEIQVIDAGPADPEAPLPEGVLRFRRARP